MKPPQKSVDKKLEYEKVVIGDMIPGIIEIVQYDEKHKFRGFEGKPDTIQPAVRFKFKLDGYKYAHYSRWMKFNVGEKSTLYSKYLLKLVENAVPNMDMDFDVLNGMKVKTLWQEKGDFQDIDSIFPIGKKVDGNSPIATIDLDEPPVDETQATEVPF